MDWPRDTHGRHDRHDGHDKVDRSVSVAESCGGSRAPSSFDSAFVSPSRDRTHTGTIDRPMQPHFPPRKEPPPVDSLEIVEFQDVVMAASEEWVCLPEHVRDACPLHKYCLQCKDSMRNRGH